MTKLLPLCIALLVGWGETYGQAPTLDPSYSRYINSIEFNWVTLGGPVSGARPMTIEWRKDGVIVPGETSSFYHFENVRRSDAGIYTLTATNSFGTVTSEPIVLEIADNTGPVARLRVPGPGSTFTPGTELTFSGYGSDLESEGALDHIWRMVYHDGNTVSPGPEVADIGNTGEGETSGIFIIDHEMIPAPGSFFRLYFTVRDNYGLTDTDSVDIAWSGLLNSSLPDFDDEPRDATVPLGSPVTFTVDANWASAYQWRHNGADIPGATGPTYHIDAVDEEDIGIYQVILSNSVGIAESREAVLRLLDSRPVIRTQPMNVTTAQGLSATFMVSAVGAASYQWLFNGEIIAGATMPTLSIDPVDFDDAGTYMVTVSNADGTVESNGAELIVVENTAPSAFIIDPQPGALYSPGTTVQLEGFGIDVEQESPISVAWSVELRRNGQSYPGPAVVIESEGVHSRAYFIAPGESVLQPGDVFRVFLTATDIQGLSSTAWADVHRATTSVVALKSNPDHLSAMINGETVMTRYARTSAIGEEHIIAPVSPQTVNGVTYAFSNWAHGGSPTQTVKASNVNTSYTINYSSPLVGSWRTTDVGRVVTYGAATFDNGTYTLTGAGNDIWGSEDAFRFVYQSVTGNVDVRARVISLTTTHPWAKAGVMIRNSTDRSAKHAMTVVVGEGGVSFQRRTEAGGESSAVNGPGGKPYWVRLVRNGDTFTSYVSPDGVSWTMIGTPETIAMNNRVYVGLVVTSHNSNTLATTTVTDVSVSSATSASSIGHGEMISGQEGTMFDVYPNPVAGNTLNIRFNDHSTGRRVQVISILGQVLYEQMLPDNEGAASITVDMDHFPSGVYKVRGSDQRHVQTRTLIRQ